MNIVYNSYNEVVVGYVNMTQLMIHFLFQQCPVLNQAGHPLFE